MGGQSKREMVVSSALCMLSSLIVGALIFCLTVIDSKFNIIRSPTSGIKTALLTVLFQCCLCHAVCSYLLIDHVDSAANPRKKTIRTKVSDMLKCGLILAISTGVFHFLAVVFGAPFLSKASETFHFACLLSGLVLLPCFLIVGPNIEEMGRIFLENRCDTNLEVSLLLSSALTLLGAWLGAIPIPLDWDRPWQKWPITCCLGALLGYSTGLFLAALYIPRRATHKTKAV